jgi:hypothetical protein
VKSRLIKYDVEIQWRRVTSVSGKDILPADPNLDEAV